MGAEIGFEAKRYDGTIPKKDVLYKIAQLIGSARPPALWVLGATVEVGTQLNDELQAAISQTGIGLLVLDWPANSNLPPLAVLCALARHETEAFLCAQGVATEVVGRAVRAMEHLRTLDGFGERAASLDRQLTTPALAVEASRRANMRWLSAAFGDRQRARSIFGQALAPSALHAMPTQVREELVQQVVSTFATAPASSIVAITGREGHGKSWLFAQAWAASAPPPLTLVVPASSFSSVVTNQDVETVLIRALIEQTGGDTSERDLARWRRQLSSWTPRGDGEALRFVVCVDGLNERPDIDWSRWLEGASGWVVQRGGMLVLTAREAYFKDRVEPSLISSVVPISVPAWSSEELRAILGERGIDAAKLRPEVFERLRNPRLLGIAFELLNDARVETFTELSVEHLLFEHIRASARTGNAAEPIEQFVKRLADHAREIIERAAQQHTEDRFVFEQDASGVGRYELTRDLLAVISEQFFQPLMEDPTLYTLPNDGLVLALGLALIKALQKAERSQRTIAEALDALLDPIEALDKTAEAVFAAILVASVDDRVSEPIQRALVGRVLRLQNLDQSNYPAFVAAVRNIPNAAMGALYDLSTGGERAGNRDWLVSALRESRRRPRCWEAMSVHLQRWLRTYSVEPALGVWPHYQNDPEKAATQSAERADELEEKQAALSLAELAFMEAMQREALDPRLLHEPAIQLLAGMPLQPFAAGIVACAFSMSFNSAVYDNYDELVRLLRFNRQDWAATRDAVFTAANFARAADASQAARWALVHILRGTSTPADADEEHQVVEILTAGREKHPGWRLVETYCDTDPCDPNSDHPSNIERTAQKYAELDVAELNKGLWSTQHDGFFDDARPGLARFAPLEAIRANRRLAQSLGGREPLSQRLALHELKPHSPVLDADDVALLQRLANELAAPYDPGSREESDRWLASQFALLLALPHLTGDGQIALLQSLPDHGPTLVEVEQVVRAGSSENAERFLSSAVQSGQEQRILLALMYLRGSRVQVSDLSRAAVANLMSSDNAKVRGFAMAVAFALDDPTAAERLVDQNWSAERLDPKESFFEIWYGSLLLVEAVKRGLLERAELLPRITPKLFGYAAAELSEEALADVLHQSITRLIERPIEQRPPPVELKVSDPLAGPDFLSFVEETDEKGGMEAALERMSETAEQFAERQRAGWRKFGQFERQLTKDQARLAIENVGYEAVETYVRARPNAAHELAGAILAQPIGRLHGVVNFGFMLARALSFLDGRLAVSLFRHLQSGHAFVRLVFGPAKVPLDAISVWGSADGAEVQALRRERLENASSDRDLSQEVLAALENCKDGLIQAYADEKLESDVPLDIARGLTVLGFTDSSEQATATLQRFATTKGFIGEAFEAAWESYQHNQWARHWFEQMAATDDAEAFWRASVLFLKVVDGRVSIWARTIERSEFSQRFGPLLRSGMTNRIEKWIPKREKTLCGAKVPGDVFTSPALQLIEPT